MTHLLLSTLRATSVGILLVLGFNLSTPAQNQSALPAPWNALNLSPAQQTQIRRIIDDHRQQLEKRLREIPEERRAILEQQNSLDLLKMDVINWKKTATMSSQQDQDWKIFQILDDNQKKAATLEFAKLEVTTEIAEFDLFKAQQNNDYFCWAAAIQMVFNYAGVPWDQEQIADSIKGSTEAATASPQEIAKKGTGWHIDHKDPVKNNWSAQFTYHSEPLPPPVLVRLIDINRIVMVEISGQHVAVIHRVRYLRSAPEPTINSITVFDPLTGRDNSISWGEAQKQISGWWEATATKSASRVFE